MKRIISILFVLLGFLLQPSMVKAEKDLDIIGSVSTGYDSNVGLDNANELDDFVTRLLLGLKLTQEGRRHSLDIEGNVIQELYADETSFNNNTQDINVDFKGELSKNDLVRIKNIFLNAERPRTFEDAFGTTTGSYQFIRNMFETQYAHSFSRQIVLKTLYGNTVYAASPDNIRDYIEHHTGLGAEYIHSSATTFLFMYDFLLKDLDPGEEGTTHNITAGVRQFFTKQLFLEARAGVGLIEDFDGDDFTKPVINLSLINDIDEKTRASLSFTKESSPNSFQQSVFDAWRVTAGLKKQLLTRLNLSTSAFYGEGDYEDSTIDESLIGTNINLNYELTKHIQTFLAYTYTDLDSNDTGRGYTRNFIQTGMNFSF